MINCHPCHYVTRKYNDTGNSQYFVSLEPSGIPPKDTSGALDPLRKTNKKTKKQTQTQIYTIAHYEFIEVRALSDRNAFCIWLFWSKKSCVTEKVFQEICFALVFSSLLCLSHDTSRPSVAVIGSRSFEEWP